MTSDRWYLHLHDRLLGPLTEGELRDLAIRKGIGPDTPVSTDRIAWCRAADCQGLQDLFAFREGPAASVADRKPLPTGLILAAVAGVGVLGVCGVLLFAAAAFLAGTAAEPSPAESVPRLEVTWGDATEELFPLVRNLPEDEQTALVRDVQRTGNDIYAVRVVFRNVGDQPVRVRPEHLQIHFAGEAASVESGPAAPFLQEAVLRPGETHTGIVTYIAAAGIGAAIRLGEGRMAYVDPAVEVVEPR